MQSINKLITILLFIAVLVLLFMQLRSYNTSSGTTDKATSELDSLQELYLKEKAESSLLKNLNDSLSSALIREISGHKEGTPSLTADEQEIHNLISNLHQGWENMVDQNDADEVLKYFMNEFTTNEVKINTENIPYVRKHNNQDYREHLDAIAEIEGLEIDMGTSKVYSIFVRDDIFGTQFLTEIRVEHNGKTVMESTVLSLVSGQREDGQWKVGNYSWIRFEYFDILSEELNNGR